MALSSSAFSIIVLVNSDKLLLSLPLIVVIRKLLLNNCFGNKLY